MKNNYNYKINFASQDGVQQKSLEISSHDDIFEKLALIDGKLSIPKKDEQAFLIGLKMAGEIILKHRDSDFFNNLKQPMKEIMNTLKSNLK